VILYEQRHNITDHVGIKLVKSSLILTDPGQEYYDKNRTSLI